MPAAGQTIRAADFPASGRSRDTSTDTGLSNSSYEATPGSLAAVSVTFIAATSGKAWVKVWAGLRAAGNARAQADFEVREDNAAGAVVRASGGNPMVGTETDASSYSYGDGEELVTGLTPGGTYYAVLQTRQSASGTYDVSDRMLQVSWAA